MKRLCGLELCFLVVVSEIVVGAVSLAAFVHELGRVIAEVERVRIRRDVFQEATALTIARLLDRSFELSQKSFVVGHLTEPIGVCREEYTGV